MELRGNDPLQQDGGHRTSAPANFLAKIEQKLGEYKLLFFLGFLLGLCVFFIIYGFDGLNIFNVDQRLFPLGSDVSFAELAGQRFMQEDWGFPLGKIETLLYPGPTSVVFTDSVPLAAIIAKLVYPLVGRPFQYAWPFVFVCYGLQGGFSAILLRRYSRRKVLILSGSLFFLFSLPMYAMSIGHPSMAGQFVLVAALCLWWHRDKPFVRKYELPLWSALMALSSLMSMYLTGMLGMLLVGYALSMIFAREGKWPLRLVLLFAVPILTTLLVFWIGGGFMPGTKGSFDVIDFSHVATLNLNSFISPEFSRHFSTLPARIFQSSHNAWLGFGVLFLLLLALAGAIVNRKKTDKQRVLALLPFIITGFLIFVFSLSPVVTFGENILFRLPLPDFLVSAWSIFRSSGRMFWPAYYMIITFAVGSLLANEKLLPVVQTALLLLAIAIQLFDYDFTRMRNIKDAWKMSYNEELTSPFWEDVVEQYEHFDTLPLGGRRGLDGVGQLAYLLRSTDISLNYYQLARAPENMVPYAFESVEQVKAGTLPENHLVVLNQLSTISDADLTGKQVVLADGMYLLLNEGTVAPGQYEGVQILEVGQPLLEDYLRDLAQLPPGYLIAVSTRADTSALFYESPGATEMLSSVGFSEDMAVLPFQSGYLALVESGSGTALLEKSGDPDGDIEAEATVGGNVYSLSSSGVGSSGWIRVNGIDMSSGTRGLNICVLDAETGRLVETAAFDGYDSGPQNDGVVLRLPEPPAN